MERIEKYGIFCRSWEGGWSKNPNDPGGATMKGVTYKTFCDHRKSKGMPKPTEAELRKITNKEWNEILRTRYWDKVKADEIKDEWIAYLLVECVWMSGTGYIKNVQNKLNLKADGIVGKKTLGAINAKDGKTLFNILWEQRKRSLRSRAVGKKAGFWEGWYRRLKGVKHGCLITNDNKELK